MKSTIESVLLNTDVKSVSYFVEIINTISSCESESELLYCMGLLGKNNLDIDKFFNWGYGSNHMWVCENGRTERLIFVEF